MSDWRAMMRGSSSPTQNPQNPQKDLSGGHSEDIEDFAEGPTDKPDTLIEPGSVSVLSVPGSGIPPEISAPALAPCCIAEWLSPALPRQQAKVLAVHEDGTFEAFHPLSEFVCRMPQAWITRITPPTNSDEGVQHEDSDAERSTRIDKQALIPLNQGTATDIEFVREADINGIRMAVATDGQAYLSERGVAALCGVSLATIEAIRVQWDETPAPPRLARIKQSLARSGHTGPAAPVMAVVNGVRQWYFPTEACRSILEYFTMDAGLDCQEKAKENYIKLAMAGLGAAIRQSVVEDPATAELRRWEKWQERIDSTYYSVPTEYFAIFNEVAPVILSMIRAGLTINAHIIPDSSIEEHWSQHWEAQGLAGRFGERIRYSQRYPPSHPYGKCTHQDAWGYPLEALGAYRIWLKEVYVGAGQFAQYLDEKVQQHELSQDEAARAVGAVCGVQIRSAAPKRRRS